MGNTLTYKGFSLLIFCQFAKQLGHSTLAQVYGTPPGFRLTNQPAFLLQQAWSAPGQQTNVEKFTETAASAAYAGAIYYPSSTAAYTDASYIRVKTIQLSYQLPINYLKVIGVKSCNINISAQNLFTITRYQGDPETQLLYAVPPMKTVTLGLQLTL